MIWSKLSHDRNQERLSLQWAAQSIGGVPTAMFTTVRWALSSTPKKK